MRTVVGTKVISLALMECLIQISPFIGDSCPDCQDCLFHRIQKGYFDFPEEEWGNISREAKDLICHLLVLLLVFYDNHCS